MLWRSLRAWHEQLKGASIELTDRTIGDEKLGTKG